MSELDGKILFGSDYNGGTNFLVSTNDMIKFDSKVMPAPYRRAVFDRLVVRRNKKNEFEIWSTVRFKHSKKVRSLVMMSNDNGETWNRIIEYDGTQLGINIISNSKEIANELYLLIKNTKENIATTIRIHA